MNQKGQSLIGVLISAAALGAMALVMATMIHENRREVKSLEEKLATLGLEKSLIGALADGSLCTFMLTTQGNWLSDGLTAPMTFDAGLIGGSNPPHIPLKKVLSHPAADAPSLVELSNSNDMSAQSVPIKEIKIADIKGPANGFIFTANLKVVFDHNKTIRAMKPVDIPTTLVTQPVGAGNMRKIVSCASGQLSADASWQCGQDPSGAPKCVRVKDGNVCQFNPASYGSPLGSWACHGASLNSPDASGGTVNYNNGWPG